MMFIYTWKNIGLFLFINIYLANVVFLSTEKNDFFFSQYGLKEVFTILSLQTNTCVEHCIYELCYYISTGC